MTCIKPILENQRLFIKTIKKRQNIDIIHSVWQKLAVLCITVGIRGPNKQLILQTIKQYHE